MAYEEPAYEVVETADGYEVRRYADRLAAQVEQTSSADGAFGKLFRYISGANQTSAKVSMTIPVAQSQRIAMTVPVAQSSSSDGGHMQFFLPASYSLETAPQPTNPDVKIVVVEGGYHAVRRYSGRPTTPKFERESSNLRQLLERDGRSAKSDPIRATYNGPFTPPFMRRNEVMVRIDWQAA